MMFSFRGVFKQIFSYVSGNFLKIFVLTETLFQIKKQMSGIFWKLFDNVATANFNFFVETKNFPKMC